MSFVAIQDTTLVLPDRTETSRIGVLAGSTGRCRLCGTNLPLRMFQKYRRNLRLTRWKIQQMHSRCKLHLIARLRLIFLGQTYCGGCSKTLQIRGLYSSVLAIMASSAFVFVSLLRFFSDEWLRLLLEYVVILMVTCMLAMLAPVDVVD